jgi:PhzF family phenazine biosynthesis protein
MTIPFSHVDAFTPRPFGGNPAVVCRVAEWPSPAWMQDVAAEMNAGATVFMRRTGADIHLRWFSPTVELDICGHGTQAAAHVLWESGDADAAQPVTFQTRAGALTAAREADRIVLDFPALADHAVDTPEGLLTSLGLSAAHYVGRNRFDYVVEVESEQAVRDLNVDQSMLARIQTRGVIVTSRAAEADIDFVSRFFAPAAGIPEDHATGSAHSCLAVYWSRRLGRTKLVARQLSRRGGLFFIDVAGDRVRLGGNAVIVSEGRLLAGPGIEP